MIAALVLPFAFAPLVLDTDGSLTVAVSNHPAWRVTKTDASGTLSISFRGNRRCVFVDPGPKAHADALNFTGEVLEPQCLIVSAVDSLIQAAGKEDLMAALPMRGIRDWSDAHIPECCASEPTSSEAEPYSGCTDAHGSGSTDALCAIRADMQALEEATVADEEAEMRLIGGHETGWSSAVKLKFERVVSYHPYEKKYFGSCTGVVVARQWVLTAAHCKTPPGVIITATTGSSHLNSGGKFDGVYPGYHWDNCNLGDCDDWSDCPTDRCHTSNDVALVQFQGAFPEWIVAKIHSGEQITQGESLIVVGQGHQSYDHEGNPVGVGTLKAKQVTVDELHNEWLTTGEMEDTVHGGGGDSGGPLFRERYVWLPSKPRTCKRCWWGRCYTYTCWGRWSKEMEVVGVVKGHTSLKDAYTRIDTTATGNYYTNGKVRQTQSKKAWIKSKIDQ